MIWAQSSLSFALWIAYGCYLAVRAVARRDGYASMAPTRRRLAAPLLMLLGGALLLGGISAIATMQGLTAAGFKPWAWLILTLLGLGFVHAQVLATALLLPEARVTQPPGRAFVPCKETENPDGLQNNI